MLIHIEHLASSTAHYYKIDNNTLNNMFSRSKNRPLELKLEDSNYAPAPSPQSIPPQPSVGQNSHAHASPKEPSSNPNKSIQKLANAYNEINRPVPNPEIDKKNLSAPTVINNYYYVQPPISPRVASAPVPTYNQPLTSESLKVSPRRVSPMIMSNHNRHLENQPSSHSRHDLRDFKDFRDNRDREELNSKYRYSSSSVSHRKSPSKYPRLPNFADSSSQILLYDEESPRTIRNSSRDFEHDQNFNQNYDRERNHEHDDVFNSNYRRRHSNHSETTGHQSFRKHTPNQNRAVSYSEKESNYDSFVKSSSLSSSTSSHKKSPTRKNAVLKDIPRDIYSSKSFDSRSMFIKSGETSMSENQAKIPDITVEPELDIVDRFNDLDLSEGFNLLILLSQTDDADINVHNDRFFEIFKQISNGSDLVTIEQLGIVLFDPYKKRGRFSFRSLALIMGTFVQNSLNNGEMDFRCFVKMCKFIKGCFTSFNYHDKIENDHMLDFNEFYNALHSNNINCPDGLLAKIFATNESIDIEHYIAAIIMIRKEEKKQ